MSVGVGDAGVWGDWDCGRLVDVTSVALHRNGCTDDTIGSWAARWQSIYRGLVPKGSLFSFLQRLGMTRKRWGWA